MILKNVFMPSMWNFSMIASMKGALNLIWLTSMILFFPWFCVCKWWSWMIYLNFSANNDTISINTNWFQIPWHKSPLILRITWHRDIRIIVFILAFIWVSEEGYIYAVTISVAFILGVLLCNIGCLLYPKTHLKIHSSHNIYNTHNLFQP